MLRFRPPSESLGPITDLLAVGELIDDAMRPGHFFVAPELRLSWIAAKSEKIRWEIFRGRLLDAAQTREEKSFLSWHVLEENAPEPTISVKLDVYERRIHVTRGLLCYIHEGFDAGGGVIETREVQKWTRELVGTINLDNFEDREPLRDELICLIWQAIVGTNRLPLTSLEAPLPAFSFGKLHYLFQSDTPDAPMTNWDDLFTKGTSPAVAWPELVKAIEFLLRMGNEIYGNVEEFSRTLLFPVRDRLDQRLSARPTDPDGYLWPVLWEELFNGVSLTPNSFFSHSLFVPIDYGASFEKRKDFCSVLARKLGRHLTAYDLIAFHHRGANYPDALLLQECLERIAPDWGAGLQFFVGADLKARLRRRAWRHTLLLRRYYEGLLVPDLPTSPGENSRVLPVNYSRVPEEQLLQPQRRCLRLFADDPLSESVSPIDCQVLALAVADLEHIDERVEMGLGLFIDRPLGYAKAIGEPDQTPMLAHEAFSPSIARRRWQELKKLCVELAISCDAEKLDPLFEHGPWPTGLPHAQVADCPRPTAALCDVRKVADDFVILRTKPVGLANMLGHFKIVESLRSTYRLRFLDEEKSPRVCVQTFDERMQPVLACFDEQMRRRIEMRVDVSQGYASRAGVELPKAGLRVVAVWEDTDDPMVLARRDVDGSGVA